MTLQDLIIIGGITGFASIIQTSAGFAFGLFTATSLILLGYPPSHAVCVTIGAVLGQNILGLWKLRHEIPWDVIRRYFLIALLALPLGVWFQYLLSGPGERWVRPVIGSILLVIVAALLLFRIKPRDDLPSYWGWITFSISGVLAGLCGMPGPPMVLWMMAQGFEPNRFRLTIWSFSLIISMATLVLYQLTYGGEIWAFVGAGALSWPTVLAGTWIGFQLAKRMSGRELRISAYVLLVLIGVAALASPLLAGQSS